MKSGVFKRTALVAALAAIGSVAQAADESPFYFYGLLDGGLASVSIKGGSSSTDGTTSAFVTGGYAPNFVGMSGTKSLDGYKAGFQLEQGFLLNPSSSTDNWGYGATNSLFNRQANLFISGDFGKLTVGTLPNIAFNSVLAVDPRAGANFGSALQSVSADGPLSTIDVGALNYTTPSMFGLTASTTYVPDSTAGSVNNTKNGSTTSGYRASVNYAASGLTATVAYFANNDLGTVAAKGTIAGATYTMGNLTLKVIGASEYSNGNISPNIFDALNTVGLGGKYSLTAKTVLDLGVYQDKDSRKGYQMNTFAFGIQQELFKDLKVYGQFADSQNKGTLASNQTNAGNYNFTSYINPNSFTVGGNGTGHGTILNNGITNGQTAQSINFGLLYSFF